MREGFGRENANELKCECSEQKIWQSASGARRKSFRRALYCESMQVEVVSE